LPHEFASLAEGYAKKQYRSSSERRYQTYVSILPWTKDLNYGRFCSEVWPLSMDEKQESYLIDPTPPPEIWEALKKQLSPKKTEFETILSKHKKLEARSS
jgi:hypothetical protein